MSGLGTSGQTFNANGNTNSFSQTNPYGPTEGGIENLIGGLGMAYASPDTFQSNPRYQNALQAIDSLPNLGPAAGQTASNIFQTGGDPLGILRQESAQIGYGANSPGMSDVLKTIQNDVSNQVNSQFAGAGRSLSGLNEQTLSRGLSQGEAVPLLNQYNQNIANQLGIQNAAMSNLGQGLNFAQAAPGLSSQNALAATNLPYQELAPYENMISPLAGLGGTVQGNQQTNQAGSGTATNSILSQLGQVGGLINPFGGLLGTLFG